MAPGSVAAALRRTRSAQAVGQPLPMIIEDDDSPPDVPNKSARRAQFADDSTASTSPMTSPYSVGFPSTIKENGWRKRQWVETEDPVKTSELQRRRRLYRLAIIAIVLVCIIVGLAVGIPLGLRKSNQSSDAPASTLPSDLFPAGSYSFTTALSGVSTGCTANPATFRCYPFNTYSSSSTSSSEATFSWIITPLTSYSYSISSSTNPFAPSFSGVPLLLLDANQYTERLVFNFSMSKSVVASQPVDPSDSMSTTCWFNSTLMSATLWTKMRADYPASIANVPAPTQASNQFAAWPYRAEVSQIQDGSSGVPTCVDANGKTVGSNLAASGRCGCYYANFGLSNASTFGVTAGTKRAG